MSNDTITRLNEALDGRYTIERELGEGGMATVYLADDLKHERRVALKVLKPELAAVVGAERFLAEIKTTANLQHPHILPLFDSGAADGFLYYVMPYVEGETLREARRARWRTRCCGSRIPTVREREHMSRSRKRTRISGITTAESKKQDKRLANRKVRRAVKRALQTSERVEILPHRRELTNPWAMAKDGKRWFDPARFPEVLRK